MSVRQKYLFVRVLEACNADCFMCRFALSNDRYRFAVREFEELLIPAKAAGVKFVRFTGGEPLLHHRIEQLIRVGAHADMRMSVITNGALLSRKIRPLAEAGLTQVIVSIDGATAAKHDHYRNSPGLFEAAISGLRQARALGVLTRVNTVVGPHNYQEMARLQQLLADIGVQQWELSAIKLDRPISYRDPEHVRSVCEPIYAADPKTMVVPMGKRFYGDTAAEQDLFFRRGITPRASPPFCNVVADVIYLDAKTGRGYGCPLLPHRSQRESGPGSLLRVESGWTFDQTDFRDHVRHFYVVGPHTCTGCSSSAAGYSDHIAETGTAADWSF
jgi:cytosylglucuronate decarboxylase